MDSNERKRLQNKLSQRKHRQKQKQRIEELELEISKLNRKLNSCIYRDQSKLQLLKIYRKTENKIGRVEKELKGLQDYLQTEIFSSIKEDVQKLHAGEIVLSEDEEEDEDEEEKEKALDQKTEYTRYNGILDQGELLDDDNSDDETNNDNVKATITNTNTASTISKLNPVNQFSSFQTPCDFNLNDFGIFDFNLRYQQNPISRIDPNSVLKYYIYNDICVHPSNLMDIINGVGNQSISYINKIQQEEDIISSPHFLNMVCSYANSLFEQIPKFKNFAFAFGGVKWLVGQVLFFGLVNPNIEPLIKPLLFKSNNFHEENYHKLVDNITKYLEISWLKNQNNSKADNISLFLLHSDTLFPIKDAYGGGSSSSSSSLTNPNNVGDTDSFILHEWFYPTALQTYLLKKTTYYDYPHWINFIIWPEMRDILLLNIHKLSIGAQDLFYNDLMDNVILILKDQPDYDSKGDLIGKRNKLFFFIDLTKLINLTINMNKDQNPLPCEPNLDYLTKHGLFNPGEWKLTKSYARKFGSLIPKKLVCWDIDDTLNENIVRPHYVT